MADVCDQADVQNELFHKYQLQVRKPEGPTATGHCLYCESGLPHGLRWCDSACQKDWEVEQAAKARNGR